MFSLFETSLVLIALIVVLLFVSVCDFKKFFIEVLPLVVALSVAWTFHAMNCCALIYFAFYEWPIALLLLSIEVGIVYLVRYTLFIKQHDF